MRGRPKGAITHRRAQIMQEMATAAASGERISFASLARRVGLYDYRDARRIVRELQKMV